MYIIVQRINYRDWSPILYIHTLAIIVSGTYIYMYTYISWRINRFLWHFRATLARKKFVFLRASTRSPTEKRKIPKHESQACVPVQARRQVDRSQITVIVCAIFRRRAVACNLKNLSEASRLSIIRRRKGNNRHRPEARYRGTWFDVSRAGISAAFESYVTLSLSLSLSFPPRPSSVSPLSFFSEPRDIWHWKCKTRNALCTPLTPRSATIYKR